jgi:hypothetical protein
MRKLPRMALMETWTPCYPCGMGAVLERVLGRRVLFALLGCIFLGYGLVAVPLFAELPAAIVCERGSTHVEATPHTTGVRFDERRVGP